MENNQIQSCIDACETCADACETCSTENKGKAGMEHSVKLCIACADACNALIAASKTNANLDALCKKCEDACNVVQQNVQNIRTWNIVKIVLMLVANVQQNAKLCLQ